jgi:hypothetical protein
MPIGHTGSWGLPDLGITEFFSDLLGKPRTPQRGSSLFDDKPSQKKDNSSQGINYIDQDTMLKLFNFDNTQQNNMKKDVLGLNTQAVPKTGTNQNTNQDLLNLQNEYEKQRNAARGEIESGFGEYERRLGDLFSLYNQQQSGAEEGINRTYDEIMKGLEQQKQSSEEKLAAGREQVKARGAQSLEDLKRNLDEVVRSMSMKLGALGAGDSSATQVMLPYAYTKLAGVQGGAIQRQVNDQLFEIDQKQRDLENQYIQLLTQTKVEKENTLDQIRSDYGQKLAHIRSLQASLPREKAEALSTLARELKNEALGRLVSLENWYRQREADLTSWANDRMNVLQSYKQQLSQTSDFSPQDIIWNNLKPVDNSGGTGTEVYTPSQLLALAKRRREELIG